MLLRYAVSFLLGDLFALQCVLGVEVRFPGVGLVRPGDFVAVARRLGGV